MIHEPIEDDLLRRCLRYVNYAEELCLVAASDEPEEDDLLRRYLRYLNCAEELRILAASKTDDTARDLLTAAAENYDRAGAALNAIMRSKRNLTL